MAVDTISKNEGARRLRACLIQGDLHGAESCHAEYRLEFNQVLVVANTAYQELLEREQFRHAIAVAEKYQIAPEKRDQVMHLEFGRLLTARQYTDAIRWAQEHRFSKSEIMNTAARLFETLLETADAPKALDVAEQYSIPDEMVKSKVLNWFNRACTNEQYYWAAKIGREYDISPLRITITAMRAMMHAIRNDDWNKVFIIQKEFDIVSERGFQDLRDLDRTQLVECIENFGIRHNANLERYRQLEDITEQLELLDGRSDTKEQKKLAETAYKYLTTVHNALVENNQIADAVRLYKRFALLNGEVPVAHRNEIIQKVQTCHNTLMEQDHYEEAQEIRKSYGLFSKNILPNSYEEGTRVAKTYILAALNKGEYKAARQAIEDYGVPPPLYLQDVQKRVLEFLSHENFEEAFEIREAFKVDPVDPLLQDEAIRQYQNAYRNKFYEVAAEIGKQFRLDRQRVLATAFAAWKRRLTARELEAASKIAKNFRLSTRMTQDHARKVMHECLADEQLDIAAAIKTQYNVHPSVWDSLIAFFQVLFGKKLEVKN